MSTQTQTSETRPADSLILGRRRKRRALAKILVGLYVAALVLTTPATATAGWTVKQGDDYDYVWTDRSKHTVHDEECDSHSVYGVSKNNLNEEDKRITSGCESYEVSPDQGEIEAHRVCETQFGLWPNDCSGWDYRP